MKKRDFALAPVTSLFRMPVYRSFKAAPVSASIGYLFYLAVIFSLATIILGTIFLMPVMNELVEWFKAEKPDIVWTPDSLEMNIEETMTMVHPAIGPMVTFDPVSKNQITFEQMGKVPLYITPQFLFAVRNAGTIETRAIAGPLLNLQRGQRERMPARIPLSDELIDRTYRMVRLIVLPVVFILLTVGTFLFSALFALAVSLVGLLSTRLVRDDVSYGCVFNLSALAITVSLWVALAANFVTTSIPGENLIFFGLPVLYLFLALKYTREPSAEKPVSGLKIEKPEAEEK